MKTKKNKKILCRFNVTLFVRHNGRVYDYLPSCCRSRVNDLLSLPLVQSGFLYIELRPCVFDDGGVQ